MSLGVIDQPLEYHSMRMGWEGDRPFGSPLSFQIFYIKEKCASVVRSRTSLVKSDNTGHFFLTELITGNLYL